MEYNTLRPQLIIAEYGRVVQKMIDELKEIDDKTQRTKAAHQIVNVMALLNPSVRDQGDFKHKLWDHLYIIAGYELDVEAPYPIPERPDQQKAPAKPAYASNHIKFRFYGRIVQEMVNKATKMPESQERDDFLNTLASYMKMSYRNWNDDKVTDDIILEHINLLSKGKLRLESITEMTAHAEQQKPPRNTGPKRDFQKGVGNNFNRHRGNKRNFRKN